MTILIILGVGMMVLPVLLVAMAGGWAGAKFELAVRSKTVSDPTIEGSLGGQNEEPISDDEKSRWHRCAWPYILFASLLLYASPLLLAVVVDGEADTLAGDLDDEVVVKTPPTPPEYSYERPEGFESVDSTSIGIVAHRVFDGLDDSRPMILSPDEKLLAAGRRDRKGLGVVRLADRALVANFALDPSGAEWAWAPDSKRLIYFRSAGNVRRLAMLDCERGSWTALPIPIGTHLPRKMKVMWPIDDEVVFATSKLPDYYLSLDTLQIQPLSESTKWSGLSLEERGEATVRTDGDDSGMTPWSLKVVEKPFSYLPPNTFQNGWRRQTERRLAIVDNRFSYQRILESGGPLADHRRILSTKDGSIQIVFTRRAAHFLYFGIRDQPALGGSFEPVELLESLAEEEEVRGHLRNHTLCAFICAPLVNPLNGKVVGPNRNRIRGLARLGFAEDEKVEVWIVEEYEKRREEDLLADLHFRQYGEPRSLMSAGCQNWWRPLPVLSQLGPGMSKTGGEMSEKPNSVVIDPVVREAMATLSKELPTRESAREPEILGVEDRIRVFVLEHHRRISRGDLGALAKDYLPEVDYFGAGATTVEKIIEDQSQYRLKWDRMIRETVEGEIKVKPLAGGRYAVEYPLRSYLESGKEKRWVDAAATVSLRVLVSGTGPAIYYQRSKVDEVKKGEMK